MGTPDRPNSLEADAVLDALGDPTRRAVLQIVAEGPVAVGEIADQLPVSRPAVSRHLRLLSEAGLVRARADGTKRLYELEAAGVEAIRGYFDDMWQQVQTRFTLLADNVDDPTSKEAEDD